MAPPTSNRQGYPTCAGLDAGAVRLRSLKRSLTPPDLVPTKERMLNIEAICGPRLADGAPSPRCWKPNVFGSSKSDSKPGRKDK